LVNETLNFGSKRQLHRHLLGWHQFSNAHYSIIMQMRFSRPALRRIVKGMGILAAALLCAMIVGAGCANQLILPPVPKDVRWDGAMRKAFSFEGKKIEYFVARSTDEDPKAFVLRITGDAAGGAKFTASRWGKRAVEAWVVNYPGYGGSEGKR